MKPFVNYFKNTLIPPPPPPNYLAYNSFQCKCLSYYSRLLNNSPRSNLEYRRSSRGSLIPPSPPSSRLLAILAAHESRIPIETETLSMNKEVPNGIPKQ